MPKTIGMTMAKATQEEAAAACDVAQMIENLHKGYFPTTADTVDTDPAFFDEDNPEHLRTLYDRLMATTKDHPGGLFRVAFGYGVILSNDLLDPSVDHLALNPKYTVKGA